MYYLWDTDNRYWGVAKDKPSHKRWTEEPAPFTVSGVVKRHGNRWVVQEKEAQNTDALYSFAYEAVGLMYLPQKEKTVFTRTGREEITVLIPCYRQEKYLRDALMSVLRQDYPYLAVEISLMYDEEPTEAQKKFASYLQGVSPNVRVYLEPRTDIAVTRNRMVDRCPTEWFIMLDADEQLRNKFALSVLSKTKADVVFTEKYSVQDPDGYQRASYNPCTALFNNASCLICKTVWNELGGMDEVNYSAQGEDTDFILRLLEQDKYRVEVSKVSRLVEHPRGASKCFWEYQWKIWSRHIDFALKCLRNGGRSIKALKRMEYFRDHPTAQGFREIQPIKDQQQQDRARFIEEFNDLIRAMNKRESSCKNALIAFDGAPFMPITGNVDAIFFVDPYANNFERVIPALIRLDWCKSIEGMTDIERMKWCMQHGKCTFAAPLSTPKIRETSEFYRLWCRHEAYREIDTGLKVSCKGQPVSFILNKACNKQCAYCNSPSDCNHYDYDQMYENFDKALTYVESKHPNNVYPQILGGEPTLWPDWFVQKIQDRLNRYNGKYLLFTNGYNRDSLWYTGENRPLTYQWHITDWHDIRDIKPLPKEIAHIVVTKQDLPYLDDFLMRFSNSHKEVFVQACTDAPGYELDAADRKVFSDKLDEYEMNVNPITGRGMSTCKHRSAIWYIDCDTMKISTCQDPGNWVPLEDIDNLVACSSCKNCQVHRC